MMQRAARAMELAKVEIRPAWADWKPQSPAQPDTSHYSTARKFQQEILSVLLENVIGKLEDLVLYTIEKS